MKNYVQGARCHQGRAGMSLGLLVLLPPYPLLALLTLPKGKKGRARAWLQLPSSQLSPRNVPSEKTELFLSVLGGRRRRMEAGSQGFKAQVVLVAT